MIVSLASFLAVLVFFVVFNTAPVHESASVSSAAAYDGSTAGLSYIGRSSDSQVTARDDFRVSSVQTLAKVLEVDITPSSSQGSRPDAVSVDGNLYVAYRDRITRRFRLIRLTQDLKEIGPAVDLFSDVEDGNVPTDIRMSKDDQGRLWYAFESARIRERPPTECDSNFLNAAMYSVSGKDPKLLNSKLKLAYGCPTGLGAGMRFMRSGTVNWETVDDPAPLFDGGKYYILTRSGLGSLQRIRSYDRNFTPLEESKLDLSPYIGSYNFSQNALVKVNGQIYLIGSADNGPPISRESITAIYAIPLSNDLKSVAGKVVNLVSRENEYNTYVVSAVAAGDKLYITYLDRWHENTVVYLEVFDAAHGFESLGRTKITSGIPDNHVTVEVLNDKVYVFHQDARGNIIAQVFAWTSTSNISGRFNSIQLAEIMW